MSEPSRKPKLHAVHAKAKPAYPPYSLVKQAILLYRGRGISREVYRRNAKAWLRAREWMGERHIHNKDFQPRWGVPGDGKEIGQVFAPRRLSP